MKNLFEEWLGPVISGVSSKYKENVIASLEAILDNLRDISQKHGKNSAFGVDVRTIARNTCLSKSTVAKWISKLVEHGKLIRVSDGVYSSNKNISRCAEYLLCLPEYLSCSDTPNIRNSLKSIPEINTESTSVSTPDELSSSSGITVLNKQTEINDCIYLNSKIENNSWCVLAPKVVRVSEQNLDKFSLEVIKPKWELWQPSYTPEEREEHRKTINQRKKRIREHALRNKAEQANLLLSEMYSNCQKQRECSGKYQYPMHPEVLYIFLDYDERIKKGENIKPEETEKDIQTFYDDKHHLLPKYKWLFQPSVKERRKCPRCKSVGKHRSMYLCFLSNSYFGAVRYHCKECRIYSDIWSEFPLFLKENI